MITSYQLKPDSLIAFLALPPGYFPSFERNEHHILLKFSDGISSTYTKEVSHQTPALRNIRIVERFDFLEEEHFSMLGFEPKKNTTVLAEGIRVTRRAQLTKLRRMMKASGYNLTKYPNPLIIHISN